MLVLSRRAGESIRIGDDITITILSSRGEARIGVTAPNDVPVHRAEIYEKIADANNGKVGVGERRSNARQIS